MAKCALLAIVACGALWFLAGIRFMDAPIRPCGVDCYRGKYGWPHTKEEYEWFGVWQTTLFAIWPFAVISLGLLAWMARADAKQSSGQNANTVGDDKRASDRSRRDDVREGIEL